ncbi:site-specific integrase [Aeromonas sp. MR16]|uniref:site-specific integrase n=1 Tax=Aeromonas sp. MR16 TaxID=2923420 RepID=UPI001F4A141D|nr:site-specific integrase [Aeromonas sp. MR16]MCH7371510.1 site-specific integrase [Aeromonas sp. MR16]
MNSSVETNVKKRMSLDEQVAHLQPVVLRATSDVDYLLNVSFVNKGSILNLSDTVLSKLTGIHSTNIRKLDSLGYFKPIYEEYEKLGVIKDGFSGLACNFLIRLEQARRYISSNIDVIQQVPIINGRISVSAFERSSLARQFRINGSKALAVKLNMHPEIANAYSDFLDWILEKMSIEGFFDKESFVSYTDKAKQRKKVVKDESAWAIFNFARKYEGFTESIYSLSHIANTNPLMALFALASKRVTAKSSINNYLATYSSFVKYLEANNINHASSLAECVNDYISLRYKSYIEDILLGKTLSPAQANTYISCLNLTLQRLVAFEEFKGRSFIYASGFDIGSSSNKAMAYTPYTPEERNLIQVKLDRQIVELKNSWLTPYVKSVKCHDFINASGKRSIIVSDNITLESLKSWFDHECDSIPFYFDGYKDTHGADPRSIFKRALTCLKNRNIYDGNISDLWGLWNVPGRIVTAKALIPLYLKLLQVTGMNPSSIIDLEIDDFVVSHDATNRPCLRYWKERSTGAKEYHLDIFNCDITWLSIGQAKVVKDIFETIIAITKHVRVNAGDDVKNKLFICNSTARNKFNDAEWHAPIVPTMGQMWNCLKDFSNDLINENGEEVEVIATRFRSSFISELIDNGVPLREIQMIMGHANIGVTLAYLDRMDFNKQSRSKIYAALTKIYENSYELKNRPNGDNVSVKNLQEVIYKTPLGGCKNIFDPPDFIKSLNSYKSGSACANFNKCLSCNNVIITRSHLPDLFALYRDYTQVARNTRLMLTPHGRVIQDNIDILESILGERSEFPAKELEVAKRLSLNIESTILIDGVSL